MQIVVLNGSMTEAEQDAYVRRVTEKYPIGSIEKIFLNIQGEYVDVSCSLRPRRELRKMTGAVIGAPEDWNYAKQAELRDTLPNPIR